MNMVDTLKGSYFSEVLPEGWDISRFMTASPTIHLPSASARALERWLPSRRVHEP